MVFPAECQGGATGAMTTQEKLLEFMLFNLTSCVSAPTCTPLTCANFPGTVRRAGRRLRRRDRQLRDVPVAPDLRRRRHTQRVRLPRRRLVHGQDLHGARRRLRAHRRRLRQRPPVRDLHSARHVRRRRHRGPVRLPRRGMHPAHLRELPLDHLRRAEQRLRRRHGQLQPVHRPRHVRRRRRGRPVRLSRRRVHARPPAARSALQCGYGANGCGGVTADCGTCAAGSSCVEQPVRVRRRRQLLRAQELRAARHPVRADRRRLRRAAHVRDLPGRADAACSTSAWRRTAVPARRSPARASRPPPAASRATAAAGTPPTATRAPRPPPAAAAACPTNAATPTAEAASRSPARASRRRPAGRRRTAAAASPPSATRALRRPPAAAAASPASAATPTAGAASPRPASSRTSPAVPPATAAATSSSAERASLPRPAAAAAYRASAG